jgi:hypothetical protein
VSFSCRGRGPHAREQITHEVCAVGRHLEERFVHEQLHHVLPPDVDDERELRLQHRRVRKILLGTNADINTARFRGCLECRNDVLILKLVRDEVFVGIRAPGSERSTIIRQKSLSLISEGTVVWTAIAPIINGRRLVTPTTIAAAKSDLREIIEPPNAEQHGCEGRRWRQSIALRNPKMNGKETGGRRISPVSAP